LPFPQSCDYPTVLEKTCATPLALVWVLLCGSTHHRLDPECPENLQIFLQLVLALLTILTIDRATDDLQMGCTEHVFALVEFVRAESQFVLFSSVTDVM
jgi:hypothetical protein